MQASMHQGSAFMVEHAPSRAQPELFCLDLFSASCAIQQAFHEAGFAGTAMYIQMCPHMDITTSTGFYNRLNNVLRLRPDGLLFCGPPCSLFVFRSSSVHRRSLQRLLWRVAPAAMTEAIYERRACAPPLQPHHSTMHTIFPSSRGADIYLGGRTAHDQYFLRRHNIRYDLSKPTHGLVALAAVAPRCRAVLAGAITQHRARK